MNSRELEVLVPSRRKEGPVGLDGRLHLPEVEGGAAGVVLCHPHPAGGGEMNIQLMTSLAVSLSALGKAVLRFNFGGVGRSEGVFSDGTEEPGDVTAAFEYLGSLPEVDGSSLSLAGWSFGAWMALMALAEGLPARRIVAVAPPLIAYDWKREAPRLSASRTGRHYIAGDRDQFCPVGTLRAFAAAVSEEDEENVTVLSGADHFLFGRENEVARLVGGIL